MPLAQLKIEDFLARLAARSPTPGGGSAAALVGALAAGLGHMVAQYTLGRPKYAAVEPQVRAIATRLERSRALLTCLVDEDAAAYEVLDAALKLDKADPARPEQLADAATVAALVPLQTAALAARLSTDLEELGRIGNRLLHSDAEAAGHLATAARRAAAAHVRANLALLRPEDAAVFRRELEGLSG